MSEYQPRFTRLTARYVRRELLRVLRRKYLPLLARHVQCQPTDPGAWAPFKTLIDVSFLRTGIEALAAMPSPRREPKPCGALAEYERRLKAWKRRRSIARSKVARYGRLVRYHRQSRKKPARAGGAGTGREEGR